LTVQPGFAQGPPSQPPPPVTSPAFVPGEILVKFQPHVGLFGAQSSLQAEGLRPLESIPRSEVVRVQVTPGQEVATVAALMDRGDVEFATPNYIIEALGDPNDTWFGIQWALKQSQDHDIDAPQAWDIHSGGDNVTVAIIDTGVDLDHPDLQANVVPGYDFVNGDSDPDDDHGHGTHVAGIAAAVGNNSTGVAGVSWGAKIMPLKVLSAAGSGNTYNLSQAIYYAADNGAKVINMSLGARYSKWPCNWDSVEAAFNYAVGKGVLMVVASGNDGQNGVNCPAAYDQVMAVGSTTSSDGRSSFSNYGSRLDIAAPGSSIYNTTRFGSYGYKSGTSMATPHVAGLAALIWSFAPSLSDSQLRAVIQNGADDLDISGWDQYYGHGRINAWEAMESVSLQTSPFTLFIGDNTGSVSGDVQVSALNPDPITWTATISPGNMELTLPAPGNGVSTASTSIGVTLVATHPVTYGTYPYRLIFTGTTSTGLEFVKTEEVTLNYVPYVYQYRFPIILKGSAP
jgi:thermitase